MKSFGPVTIGALALAAYVFHTALFAVRVHSASPFLNTLATGAMVGCMVATCAWVVFAIGPFWYRFSGLALFVATGVCGVATGVGAESWDDFRPLPLTMLAVQFPMWIVRLLGWRLHGQTRSLTKVNRFSIADLLAVIAFSAFAVWGATIMPHAIESVPMFFVTISIASAVVAIPAILTTLGDANVMKGLRRSAVVFLFLGMVTSAIALLTWEPSTVALGGWCFFFGMYSAMNAAFFVLRPSGAQLMRQRTSPSESPRPIHPHESMDLVLSLRRRLCKRSRN